MAPPSTESPSRLASEAEDARDALELAQRLSAIAQAGGVSSEARVRLEAEARRSLADAEPVRLSVAREILGVSDNTVRAWIRKGRLRPVSRRPLRVGLAEISRLLTLGDAEYLTPSRHPVETLGEIATAHPFQLVVLFGSVARGDERPDSDIDLLVAAEEAGAESRRRLAAEIEDRLERTADIIDLRDATGEPLLLLTILAEGRVLLDRDDHWAQLNAQRSELVHGATRARRRLWEDAQDALEEMRAAG